MGNKVLMNSKKSGICALLLLLGLLVSCSGPSPSGGGTGGAILKGFGGATPREETETTSFDGTSNSSETDPGQEVYFPGDSIPGGIPSGVEEEDEIKGIGPVSIPAPSLKKIIADVTKVKGVKAVPLDLVQQGYKVVVAPKNETPPLPAGLQGDLTPPVPATGEPRRRVTSQNLCEQYTPCPIEADGSFLCDQPKGLGNDKEVNIFYTNCRDETSISLAVKRRRNVFLGDLQSSTGAASRILVTRVDEKGQSQFCGDYIHASVDGIKPGGRVQLKGQECVTGEEIALDPLNGLFAVLDSRRGIQIFEYLTHDLFEPLCVTSIPGADKYSLLQQSSYILTNDKIGFSAEFTGDRNEAFLYNAYACLESNPDNSHVQFLTEDETDLSGNPLCYKRTLAYGSSSTYAHVLVAWEDCYGATRLTITNGTEMFGSRLEIPGSPKFSSVKFISNEDTAVLLDSFNNQMRVVQHDPDASLSSLVMGEAIPVGRDPQSAAINQYGSKIFIANRGDDTITSFNLAEDLLSRDFASSKRVCNLKDYLEVSFDLRPSGITLHQEEDRSTSLMLTTDIGLIRLTEEEITSCLGEEKLKDEEGIPITSCNSLLEKDLKTNVRIGKGHICLIRDGVTIEGDVQLDGGSLSVYEGSRIHGNIYGTQGSVIQIYQGSTITGNIELTGPQSLLLSSEDIIISGNIHTENMDKVFINKSRVGGDVVSTDTGQIDIRHTSIGGNLTIINPRICQLVDNTVGGTDSNCQH